MLQLAHVARPVVVAQGRQRRRRHRQPGQAQPPARLFEEMAGQNRDVVQPFAQGRHLQRVDAEAVIEVGAEAALAHLDRQDAIGGGDDAHVDMMKAVGADPLHLAELHGAQQLGLDRQGQLPDLVQKERAAMGQFELAGAVGRRAGEGAAHMAEQFGLGQRVRQGGAVDMHQRLGGPAGARMDDAGQHFLAGAGLARQQHGQVRAGDHVDFAVERLHHRAVAEQRAAALQRLADQFGGDLAAMLGQGPQGADIALMAQGHGGDGGKHLQHMIVDPLEAPGPQGIGGQRAERGVFVIEAAAETGMHGQLAVLVAEQLPIVGIGPGIVGGKPHRHPRRDDGGQTRMFVQPEPAPQHLRRQAARGDRHQFAVLIPQQGACLIAGHAGEDVEKAVMPVAHGQIVGQVEHGFAHGRLGHFATQVRGGWFRYRCHLYSVVVDLTLCRIGTYYMEISAIGRLSRVGPRPWPNAAESI